MPPGRLALLAGILLVFAVLLFGGLGHYDLWDDEAGTALTAKGVLRTGDTSIDVGNGNMLLYRNGLDVRNFCDHSMPPMEAYLTALSFKLFGLSAWSARLPFAVMGLATAALILFWARRESLLFLGVLGLGLIGNVSLILFLRQCRYYAPSILFSTAIAYVYWRGKPDTRTLLTLSFLSALLFATNYLEYLALYACLALDYVCWKRREWPFTLRRALCLFGPQAVLNGIIASIWNPLLSAHAEYLSGNSLVDRLTLFYWYFRDMNACEFLALPAFLLALAVGLWKGQAWLVRGCVAALVYIAVISFISPQPVSLTFIADVRYGSTLIPLFIALEAGALCVLFARQWYLALGAAVILFGTNLLNGGPLMQAGFRSTLVAYAGELLHPPPEPNTLTANWIKAHVPKGASVWVEPEFQVAPLMFHAPDALYAWQLDWPPRADFVGLPPIQFKGQAPPDYVVVFGPALNDFVNTMRQWNRPDVAYREVDMIDTFWRELYRPELLWRSFVPMTSYDRRIEAIYIFQRIPAAAKPAKP